MFFSLKRLFLLGFIFFHFFTTFSQTVPLRIQGTVSDETTDLGGATVQVTSAGKVFTSVMTDAQGSYYFELPLGGDYLVTVSKEGYVPKKFTVNTQGVPPEKGTVKDPFPVI